MGLGAQAAKLLFCALTLVALPVAGQTVQQAAPLGQQVRVPTDATGANAEAVAAAGSDPASDTPHLLPSPANSLTLADVIASLYRSYPEILQARLEAQRTGGDLLAAYGEFDTRLRGETLLQPLGDFENYRHQIGVARQTWWGGNLSAGYRLGRGELEPWYKERETEKGGEFALGLGLPLLQGRAIDPQRVAVFRASYSRQAVEPFIQQAILEAARDAAVVYWDWVARGAILEAQRELLELSEIRGAQYEAGVAAGRFAEIDLLLNQQLIAERRGMALESEQKYRAAAFTLSLFLRGEAGQPVVPSDDWLPRFPRIQPPPPSDFQEDLANALTRRPEPRLLQIEWQQIELERRLARNNLLPRLDLVAEASQDVGTPATLANDKGELQLLVGVAGEVPLQRRRARGTIQSTSAKMAQISQELRFQQDRIAVELQTAHNALQLSAQAVEQAEASLRAATETLERYRFAFERGRIDLIYLNLLETKVNETEIKLVDVQRGWFAALVDMQAALGLDPLDQASLVSAFPPADTPGPGILPKSSDLQSEDLERDWEIHVAPKDTQ